MATAMNQEQALRFLDSVDVKYNLDVVFFSQRADHMLEMSLLVGGFRLIHGAILAHQTAWVVVANGN
jgi:hypothetical protein